MKITILGPYLPDFHKHGKVVDAYEGFEAEPNFYIVIGSFLGQVATVPDTWLNRIIVRRFKLKIETLNPGGEHMTIDPIGADGFFVNEIGRYQRRAAISASERDK